MDEIQLKLSLSMGKDGIDKDPNNPPSRAFSALMANGKHHKSQSYCFFGTPDEDTSNRWLGVFLHTVGNRILFFPGLPGEINWIEKDDLGFGSDTKDIKFDHITVELARQRWHFSAPESKKHRAGGRTPKADEDTYFWVGISVPNYQAFSSLHKNTYIIHESLESDSERRLELLKKLENSTTYKYIATDSQVELKSFLHTCIVFSKPTANTYQGTEWLIPKKSPYVNLPPRFIISKIRINRFPLSNEWDVQIATMWLPGTISRTVIFTTHASTRKIT